jgi:hypothetical protein
MGVDALMLQPEEILSAPFGGWDATSAKMFGYTTFWVNRLNLPAEELDLVPDDVGGTLTDLVDFRQELDGRRVRRTYRSACCRISRGRSPEEWVRYEGSRLKIQVMQHAFELLLERPILV